MVDSENVMRLDRPGRALFIPNFNISAYNRLFTSLFDLFKIHLRTLTERAFVGGLSKNTGRYFSGWGWQTFLKFGNSNLTTFLISYLLNFRVLNIKVWRTTYIFTVFIPSQTVIQLQKGSRYDSKKLYLKNFRKTKISKRSNSDGVIFFGLEIHFHKAY